MHNHAFVLALTVAPLLSFAQERTIVVEVPAGEAGAVYSPFGLVGAIPYRGKIEVDKVERIFIVTKGLHFQDIATARIAAPGVRITPFPYASKSSHDSIEPFRLADTRMPAGMNIAAQVGSNQHIANTESMTKAGREYLAQAGLLSNDADVRLELVPTYLKSYSWYGMKSVFIGIENYSIIHEIKWALMDARSGRELFSKEVHGGHYIGRIKMVKGQDIATTVRQEENHADKKAFVSSLQSLLLDTAFLAIVRKGSVAPNATELDLLTITNSTSTHAATIQQCLPSVVTIRSSSGFGSGFFIAEDGHLLTNDHVLGPQDSTVTVTLNNGFALQANVVRRQPKADVALLRISGARMMPLRCDSTAQPTATEVYAIGTPERTDLAQTLTKGIISGHRELDGRSYIQTDVAINRGNSGGPLIDAKGNVIGIVSAKMMGVGTESLGFAIPIGEAFKVLAIQ